MGCGASSDHEVSDAPLVPMKRRSTVDIIDAKLTKTEKEDDMKQRNSVWGKLRTSLPRTMSEDDCGKRKVLFQSWDKTSNGMLNLTEIEQGCEGLGLNQLTRNYHAVYQRAFSNARKAHGKVGRSSQFIDEEEFRLLLVYLYNYFELRVMFDQIDRDGKDILTLENFVAALGLIKTWGVDVTDPPATFKEIDTSHSGTVCFDEFAEWATRKSLDADGNRDNLAAVQPAAR